MPILQVKQVRRPGTILAEHVLDHEKINQQSQGEARQEPRHPRPGARRHGKRKNSHKPDHDPELLHQNLQQSNCTAPWHVTVTRRKLNWTTKKHAFFARAPFGPGGLVAECIGP